MANANTTETDMNWTIWAPGGETNFTGTEEELVAHLQSVYPTAHVEAFTDQVLVYESADDLDNDVEPFASAVPA